jgi:PAS domain S-box-containing protein
MSMDSQRSRREWDPPVVLEPARAASAFGDWRSVVGTLHEAVIAAGTDHVVLYVNGAAATLLGWDAGTLIGHPLTTIVPERFRSAHEAGFRRFVETREGTVLGRPLRLPALRSDGTEIEVELVLSLADLPTGTVLIGLLRDVSERLELEGFGELADALLSALSEAPTLSDALPRVLQGLGESLNWDVVQLWLVEPAGRELRRRAVWAHDPGSVADFTESSERVFIRGAGLPGGVWESGRPASIADVTVANDFPRASDAAAAGLRSAFAFPLLADREVVGVVEMLSSQPHGLSAGLVQRIVALGSRLGGFIDRRVAEEERLSLLEAERAARESAERAQARLGFLSDASTLLSESLDLEVTLDRVASLAVPALGDWCVIHLVDRDQVSVAAVGHADESKVALLRRAHEQYPVRLDAPGGVGRAITTGEVLRHDRVTDDVLRRIARDATHLSMLRDLQFGSLVTVPLRARGRQVGAVTVATNPERPLPDGTVEVVVELARRAATAIDNAQLHHDLQEQAARSASLAQILQQSLLPPALPHIPGLRLAADYVPATRGMDVGGDFYDVFRLGRGTWGIVVGDVCGHGAQAAAVTAFARYTLRAAAGQTRSPVRSLRLLNDAMRRHPVEGDIQRFVTVVDARVRARRGAIEVTFAVGGHPLPVLRRANGTTTHVGEHGTLVGILEHVSFRETDLVLHPGDRLVIVTDGVIEARHGVDEFGTERLLDSVRATGGLSAAEAALAVSAAATAHAEGDLLDDIAVFVLDAE